MSSHFIFNPKSARGLRIPTTVFGLIHRYLQDPSFATPEACGLRSLRHCVNSIGGVLVLIGFFYQLWYIVHNYIYGMLLYYYNMLYVILCIVFQTYF